MKEKRNLIVHFHPSSLTFILRLHWKAWGEGEESAQMNDKSEN